MNTSILFLVGLFALPALIAQAKIERLVEKSFPVSGVGTLRLETQGGQINVSPGKDSIVKITARERIRADSEAEADAILKKLDLSFAQNGNDVSATAKYENQPIGFHWGSWPPVNVDFIVTVPPNFVTDLHTSGGGITVGDLGGKVTARTSGGSIKLGKIGAEINAHTSGGGISVDEARGPATLKTSGGSIAVGRVAGPAELSTSGGGIKIESVEGSIQAHTSGGSVHAGIAGPLKEDSSLSTSGGSVSVKVAKTVAFRLDAATSGGGVDASGLTLTLAKGSRGRHALAGEVNGGGPLLKLRTSGGSIVVRAD
jgi:DUF4097 and DUF4098 domain-containing protein YvlB